MALRHKRARICRLAAGAVVVAASATLASGPAAGVEVLRATGPDAPVPPPAVPAATAPAAAAAPTDTPVFPPLPPVPWLPNAPQLPTLPPALVPLPQQTTAIGAFLGSDAGGVGRIASLSRWLGDAEIRVGHTYLPGNRWSDIEGDVSFLDAWARWRNERPERMFVLNVPLQERNEAGLSDDEVGQLLRQGAAGAFDHHFRALAERLVRLKVPDTVLVLGWEMNGVTYSHRCGPDPEAWKQYWNRIVTTMRSVPGQRFRFDFAPSRGLDAVAWTRCYPGDDTVDIIGMDSYDQPARLSFDQQVTEPYGLQAHVDFAAAHGKPISYPEWGLFRNGDNAEYVRRMLAWMDDHRPLYQALSDYCPHGVWRCGDNPKASRVYRSVLFGRTGGTVPGLPPAPATPQRPKGCSPLDLGGWVEYWLGGTLCIRFDWWSRER
ncbi:glycoside hydrolase family 26 protein [Streptomyces sp. NPDC003697]